MSKHAPRPWNYITTPGSDHQLCTIYDANGKTVARNVGIASVNLIAAAPIMFEALETIDAILGQLICPTALENRIRAIAKQAIEEAQ